MTDPVFTIKAVCEERHKSIDKTMGDLLDVQRQQAGDLSAIRQDMAKFLAASTEAENRMLRRILPWLIAALLAGGGGASLLSNRDKEEAKQEVYVPAPESHR